VPLAVSFGCCIGEAGRRICPEPRNDLGSAHGVPMMVFGVGASDLALQRRTHELIQGLKRQGLIEGDRKISGQRAGTYPRNARITGKPRPKPTRKLRRPLQTANLNARPPWYARVEGHERHRNDDIERDR
jgi:hypothetical protein